MQIHRLCKERYSPTVLSGEGGLHADGRWHTQGQPIVYCASSEALAVLELRVHIGHFLPRDPFTMHAIDVPDSLIEPVTLDTLPAAWNAVPHFSISQGLGDTWLTQRRSAALLVPSIHSATEFNVLLNPRHDLGSSITVRRTWTYRFDPRLFAT
jgi:RES domain-containing protein